MFHAATDCSVGNGELTLFWYDCWIGGRSAISIAPDLIACIKPANALRMTVAEALSENHWISKITGTLTVPAIVQFLELWQAIRGTPPLSAEVDNFRWKLTANGCYTARSAYVAYFHGNTQADYAENLWSSWAPLKEKLFMWLALRNRCWTGARLLRKGLQGPAVCLLCDQQAETMDHLLLQCPTARSIWFQVMSNRGFGVCCPTPTSKLRSWWAKLGAGRPRENKRELTTLAIAVCRRLWLERNDRNFERKKATNSVIIRLIQDEFELWLKARRKTGWREE